MPILRSKKSIKSAKETREHDVRKEDNVQDADTLWPCPLKATGNGCTKMFKSKREAVRHMAIHEKSLKERKTHFCPICGRSFTRAASMRDHIKMQHNDVEQEGHRCEICGKTYKRNHALNAHVRKQHHENPEQRKRLACPTCGLRYDRKDHLEKHVRIHEGGRLQYSCPGALEHSCYRSFDTSEEADAHYASRHYPDIGDGLTCPESDCRKRFNQPRLLEQHIKNVHLHFKYICTYPGCEEQLASPACLKKHISNMHSGREMVVCPDCGKKFSSNSLRGHRDIAHRLGGHPCPLAEQFNCEFLGCSPLIAREHAKQVHLKERNYPCPEKGCMKRCSSKSNLKMHVDRMHKKLVMVWKCTVPMCPRCITGKPFSTLSVRVHMAMHQRRGHLVDVSKCLPERIKQSDVAPQVKNGASGQEDDYFDADMPEAEDSNEALDFEDEDSNEALDFEDEDEDEHEDEHEDDYEENVFNDETAPNVASDEQSSDHVFVGEDEDALLAMVADQDIADLGVTRKQIAAQNQEVIRSGCKILDGANGWQCLGPRPILNGLLTEICPHNTIIDFETAPIIVRRGFTPTLNQRCTACHYAWKLHYAICGQDLQMTPGQIKCAQDTCLDELWRSSRFCQKHFQERRKLADTKKISSVKAAYEKAVLYRWTDKDGMRKLTDLLAACAIDPTLANNVFCFDLEYNIVTGEIYEIGICNGRGEKVLDCHTGSTPREKEILLAKKGSGHWYGAPATFVIEAWKNVCYKHDCSDGFLTVKQVAEKMKAAGISPRSILVAWATNKGDMRSLQGWLEAGGYGNILPEIDTCLLPMFTFKTNLRNYGAELNDGKGVCCKLEFLFPVIFTQGHHLSGQNHKAIVDAYQLWLLCKALAELLQKPSQRPAEWLQKLKDLQMGDVRQTKLDQFFLTQTEEQHG